MEKNDDQKDDQGDEKATENEKKLHYGYYFLIGCFIVAELLCAYYLIVIIEDEGKTEKSYWQLISDKEEEHPCKANKEKGFIDTFFWYGYFLYSLLSMAAICVCCSKGCKNNFTCFCCGVSDGILGCLLHLGYLFGTDPNYPHNEGCEL